MKLTVPTSWNDISIAQFQQLHKLHVSKLAEDDAIDYLVTLISICCNEKYETIAQFSIDQIRTVGAKLSFVNVMPAQKKIQQSIQLEKEYVCQLAIEKVSAGQYIDLKSYVKAGVVENIHNILTVFYIPRMEKYCQTPPSETSKKFLDSVSIADAYPIAVFFWNLVNNSMEIIQDSLLTETTNQIRKALELQVQTMDSTIITAG
jgi:hypothetical protein